MTKIKPFFIQNPWKKILLGIGVVAMFGGGGLGSWAQTPATTPEKCFEFSNGTITKYKKGAFSECGTEVNIPATINGQAVDTIGSAAFEWNYLKSISLPESLKTIGANAFNANYLSAVVVPDSVTSMDPTAFGRNRLMSFTAPEHLNLKFDPVSKVFYKIVDAEVTIVGNGRYGGTAPRELIIPSQLGGKPVTKIGNYAFRYNYETFSKVILPSTLKEIGNQAFFSTYFSDTNIVLPKSLTKIGSYAFGVYYDDTLKEFKPHNQIKLYRESGLAGVTLAEPNNIAINPIQLKINFHKEDGTELKKSEILYGSNKASLAEWTTSTAGQYFQPGETFTVKGAQIAGYLTSAPQKITFPTTITPKNAQKEVTFVYTKKGLVLHYTFDEENILGKDSSGKGNNGTSYGNPQRDDLGRDGGAAYFDGKDDYIDVVPSESLKAEKNLTISAWIYPEAYPTSLDTMSIINWLGAYYLSLCKSKSLCGYWYGKSDNQGTYFQAGTDTLLNKRTLATISWDDAHVNFYMDGNLVKSIPSTGMGSFRAGAHLLVGRGDKRFSRGFKGLMDDVRIYNYALDSAEVKGLYQSYGAESQTVQAKLSVKTDKTKDIIGDDARIIEITSQLFRPSKNYTLEVARPAGLRFKNYEMVPLEGGLTPNEDAVKSEKIADGTEIFSVKFRDGLVGDVNTPFSFYFPYQETAHEQQETIVVRLKKLGRVVAQEELTLQAYNKSRITSYGITSDPALLAQDIPITYKVISQLDSQKPGTSSWGWGDVVYGAMYYDTLLTIPLPQQAVFVSAPNSNTSYDRATHSVKIKLGKFRDWQNRQYFTVKYQNVEPGDRVQGGDLVYRGLEGGKIPRQFVYSGINGVISKSTPKITPIVIPSLGNVNGMGSFIPGTKDGGLFHFSINNQGNVTITGVELKLELPDGLEGKFIRVPNSEGSLNNWKGPLMVTYDTNQRSGLTKTIVTPHNMEVISASQLGLRVNEYLKVVKFKWAKFDPGDHSLFSVGSSGSPVYHFAIGGDVAKTYANGSALKGGDPLVLKRSVSGNGMKTGYGTSKNRVATKIYTPIAINIATQDRKQLYNQGATISIIYKACISSYPYANGFVMKNPTLFLLVPEGFELLEDQLKVAAPFAITSLHKITPAGNIGEATVYKLQLSGDMQVGKYNPQLTLKLKVAPDAVPGDYDFTKFILLGSEDPMMQPYGSYGVRYPSDDFGLLGSVGNTIYKFVYPWYKDYKIEKITIAGAGFGVSTSLKSDVDGSRKGAFDADNPLSWSNFKSNATSNYTIKLYNVSNSEVKDFSYTIKIPQEGTSSNSSPKRKNEWSPKLHSIKTENPKGTIKILYSTDGTNFVSSVADPSKVKLVKIQIPSLQKGEKSKITVTLKAPSFRDEAAGKRAYLEAFYQLGSARDVYQMGMAGLRLVRSDYSEEEEAKYAFCSTQSVMDQNPNISENECRALIDLYLATNGSTWKGKIGREQANQSDRKRYIKKICTWAGVACAADGSLTQLDLHQNNLRGTLPVSFKALKKLTHLNLSDNTHLKLQISNIQSPKLQELNLAHIPLNVALPADFFSMHPNLRTIDLSKTNLQGVIPPLGTKLEKILLSNNRIGGPLPSTLGRLDNLQVFKADNNYLIEPLPSSLKRTFSKLETFDISRNYIAEIRPSQTYMALVGNNPVLKGSADERNRQQYRLAFLDTKGHFIKKIEHLKLNQKVGIKLVKQLNKSGGGDSAEFMTMKNALTQSDIEPLRSNQVHIEGTFPDYKVSLLSDSDGYARTSIKNVSSGTWSSANIVLSLGEIDDAEGPSSDVSGYYTGLKEHTLGTGLNFELGGKYLDEYFSVVHFNVAGNDFGGGFFWLPVEKLDTPVYIKTKTKDGGEEIKKCSNKVRGFYYNSQRGERLRPLDQLSSVSLQKFSESTYGGLTLEGGWYTSCEGISDSCVGDNRSLGKCQEDPHGIYGAIIHKYQDETFHLNAGIAYDPKKNKMKADGLQCNFQRLNNSYPFGYIYDDYGHIGFVGAKVREERKANTAEIAKFHIGLNEKLDAGNCISNIFYYDGHEIGYSATNTIPGFPDRKAINDFLDINPGSAKTTLFNLGIRGIVGFTREINNKEKSNFEKNNEDQTLLVRTDETISKVVNVARKNAEKLCRGKWQSNFSRTEEQVICIKGAGAISAEANDLADKTVIIQGMNLKLNPNQTSDSGPITLFIDGGNLFLPSMADTGNMQGFDSFGYTTNACNGNQCSKANYLKGNFIINGLLLGGDNGTETIGNKLYIHGKFLSFNTFNQPIKKRVQTIHNILGKNWNNDFEAYIAFDQLFTWWCDLGKGSDGTWCRGVSRAEREKKGRSSLLIDKSFSLIDMNFDNLLFR